MTLAQRALLTVVPHSSASITIKYSAKFNDYNANISHNRLTNVITCKLSHSWKDVDEDIVLGLLEYLIAKVYKRAHSSIHTQYYDSFLQNLEKYAPIQQVDSELAESFQRLNAEYFENDLTLPNLVWGKPTKRKMGHYNYVHDTIMISLTLKKHPDLRDYVLYHEMLHKKHRYYKTHSGRSMHHHTAFRADEDKYPNKVALERKLSRVARGWFW